MSKKKKRMVCVKCGFEIADPFYRVGRHGPTHARPCPKEPPTEEDFEKARKYLEFIARGVF